MAVSTISRSGRQAAAAWDLVQWFATASEWERAEQAAQVVSDAKERTQILTRLVVSLVKVNTDQAVRLGDAAEEAALSITDLPARAEALSGLAESLAKADPDRAGLLVDAAEQALLAITDLPARAKALSGLAESLAKADPDRAGLLVDAAEQALLAITDLPARAEALSGLAESLAKADPDRARRLASLAKIPADASGQAQVQAKVLNDQVRWLAKVEPVRARPLVGEVLHAVHSITQPQRRTRELRTLVENLTGLAIDHYPAAQDPDLVGTLAGEAVYAAMAIPDQGDRQQVLRWLVTILAKTGQWDRAEEAARAVTDPQARAQGLTSLIGRLVGVQPDPSEQLPGEPGIGFPDRPRGDRSGAEACWRGRAGCPRHHQRTGTGQHA